MAVFFYVVRKLFLSP